MSISRALSSVRRRLEAVSNPETVPGGLPLLRYHPLPSSSAFRVLDILPDRRDKVIRCRLRLADVGDDTYYCALSYTWGDQGATEKIICDDQVAFVTPMLCDGLRRFRRSSSTVATVWADAICISQSDNAEKSAQVLLMKHIFRNAAQVCAYLGEADFDYTKFGALYDLCTAICQEIPPATLMQLQPGSLLWQTLNLPPASEPVWRHLIGFITHPWFKRVWILQESCLGSDVVVTYGPFNSPIDSVLAVLGLFYYQGFVNVLLRVASDHTTKKNLVSMNPFLPFLHGCRKKTQAQSQIPLHELLIRLPAYRATDARDQVYALMGLTSDLDAPELKPDYTSKPEVVYTKVCEYSLRVHGSLHFLYDCSMQKNIPVPSWVPDWSAEKTASSLTREFNLSNGLVPDIYNATAGSRMFYEVKLAQGLLKLRGTVVDEIIAMTDDHWKSMKPSSQVVFISPNSLKPGQRYKLNSSVDEGIFVDPFANASWFLDSLALAKRATSSLVLEASPERIHLSTLTVNNPPCGQDAAEGFQWLWTQYDIFKRAIETKTWPSRGEVEDFLQLVARVCPGRRICLTSRGYLSHVPAEAEIGDKIAVFLGAIVPFVIRAASPDKQVHVVVGECYVHGIMNGEGLKLSGVEIEDIGLV